MEFRFTVRSQVPVFSQTPLHLLDYRWLHNPPIEGLLPPTGIEHTLFRKLVSKVTGYRITYTGSKFFLIHLDYLINN